MDWLEIVQISVCNWLIIHGHQFQVVVWIRSDLVTMGSETGDWPASLLRWSATLAMAALSAWKLVDLVAPDASTRREKPTYPRGFPGLVGNTPIVELSSLSAATGCTILVRLNPLLFVGIWRSAN